MTREVQEAIEAKEDIIQQLKITVEELRSELEIHEKREEERKKEEGVLGKIQATVNNAIYKTKYEDTNKRLGLHQEEYNREIKLREERLIQKETELIELVKKNEAQIKAASNPLQAGHPEIKIVELYQAKIEVREKKIFLDRHIIEASDEAKFTVLENERKLIKEQFQKLFRK